MKFLAAALCLLPAGFACVGADLRVRVAPTGPAAIDLPCRAALPADYPHDRVRLVAPDGRSLPAQIVRDDGLACVLWIRAKADAERPGEYNIRPGDDLEPGITVTPEGSDATIAVRGEPFTTWRARSGHKPILYPLLAADGSPVTRAFPMGQTDGEKDDHPHHRSFWFTHGNVNGVDFWAESPKSGTIMQTDLRVESGPVAGRVMTANDWIAPDGSRICTDRRVLTVYNVHSGRLFDFEVTVRATDGQVLFGDTKEGSFGIRTAATMKPDAKLGGVVVNANGDTNAAAWGKRAAWVDSSGPVGDKTLGIAIFEDPASFRAPTYWHARTYGLVAANPFGVRDFLGDKTRDGSHRLAPGESVTFRYRVWIHEGTAAEARVADVGLQIWAPPAIEVVVPE